MHDGQEDSSLIFIKKYIQQVFISEDCSKAIEAPL